MSQNEERKRRRGEKKKQRRQKTVNNDLEADEFIDDELGLPGKYKKSEEEERMITETGSVRFLLLVFFCMIVISMGTVVGVVLSTEPVPDPLNYSINTTLPEYSAWFPSDRTMEELATMEIPFESVSTECDENTYPVQMGFPESNSIGAVDAVIVCSDGSTMVSTSWIADVTRMRDCRQGFSTVTAQERFRRVASGFREQNTLSFFKFECKDLAPSERVPQTGQTTTLDLPTPPVLLAPSAAPATVSCKPGTFISGVEIAYTLNSAIFAFRLLCRPEGIAVVA